MKAVIVDHALVELANWRARLLQRPFRIGSSCGVASGMGETPTSVKAHALQNHHAFRVDSISNGAHATLADVITRDVEETQRG